MTKSLFISAVLACSLQAVKITSKQEECNAGLQASLYNGYQWINNLPDVSEKAPIEQWIEEGPIDWEGFFHGLAEQYVVHYEGWVDVPVDGVWTFGTASDDGSMLYIDGEPVVDSDWRHVHEMHRGDIELAAGKHKIKVEMFQCSGAAQM